MNLYKGVSKRGTHTHTHTHKINVLVTPTENISHISWNKHYTDHNRNYVVGIVCSAAAVLHLVFCLFSKV